MLDVVCFGRGMIGMWNVWDVGCFGCEMLGMWGIRGVRHSKYEMSVI